MSGPQVLRPLRSLVRGAVIGMSSHESGRQMLRTGGRLGVLPARLYRNLAPDPDFLVAAGPHQFRYLAGPGDVVGNHLFWSGLRRWEVETWRVFVPLAKASRGFVDIGAFTGAYSLVGAAVNASLHCIAFEPVPAVFERLVANVEANALSSRVTARNAAITSEDAPVSFFIPDRALPDTGHLATSSRTPQEAGRWGEVPGTRLASALPDDFMLDLIKIDVEDAEGPVVEAIADVLNAHRPTVIMELLASGSHRQASDVLHDLGYSFQQLTGGGLVRVERPNPRPGDPYMNYLCTPR